MPVGRENGRGFKDGSALSGRIKELGWAEQLGPMANMLLVMAAPHSGVPWFKT